VGLLQPDSGSVAIHGQLVSQNLRTTKAIVGYIPDDEGWFIKELTAREYIALLAEVYAQAGVTHDTQTQAKMLARSLYFTAFDTQLQHLSHGNKKKVQLIAGLMHSPQIIIIDELRNGLDPLAIMAAEQLLQQEAKRGACIIAATHDLWWAERIASTILLLIDGTIAVQDSKRRIVKEYGSVEQLFISTVQLAS
jgi:ABC-2 type transport system ATP-binding protein